MATMLDTTNWVSYPFELNGIDFVSKLDPQGSFYPQIEALPNGVFTQWNQQMVLDVIGDPTKFSHEELLAELDRVNAGASEAILALA